MRLALRSSRVSIHQIVSHENCDFPARSIGPYTERADTAVTDRSRRRALLGAAPNRSLVGRSSPYTRIVGPTAAPAFHHVFVRQGTSAAAAAEQEEEEEMVESMGEVKAAEMVRGEARDGGGDGGGGEGGGDGEEAGGGEGGGDGGGGDGGGEGICPIDNCGA